MLLVLLSLSLGFLNLLPIPDPRRRPDRVSARRVGEGQPAVRACLHGWAAGRVCCCWCCSWAWRCSTTFPASFGRQLINEFNSGDSLDHDGSRVSVPSAGSCWPLRIACPGGRRVHRRRHPRRRPAAHLRRHGLQLPAGQHRRPLSTAAHPRGDARAVRHRLLPRRRAAPRRQHARSSWSRAPVHRELRDQGQQGHQDRGPAEVAAQRRPRARARPSTVRCSRT